MANRLHHAADADMYHSYDPTNHFETTAKKVHIRPDDAETHFTRLRNDEWRKFAGAKNLTPSYFHDLESQKKEFQARNFATNIYTVEEEARRRKDEIRSQ
jgi:hypothetical protein